MINASFEKVEKIEKHPNADKLDILTVSGYTVVSQKDTYTVGDIVFFIREDSQILIDEQKFPWHKEIKTYLGKNGRVKTIKLRGIFSSGIIMPGLRILNLMPDLVFNSNMEFNTLKNINEKLEDEKILEKYCGIKHYVSPIVGTSFGNTLVLGELPFGLNKTDEENWQNLENLPFDEKVLLTKKKDGTSCTICFHNNGEYHICGRNWELDPKADNIYNEATKELVNNIINNNVLDFIDDNEIFVIRGEICGKGIQSKGINKDCLTDKAFYVFKTMIIDKNTYKIIWNGNYKDKGHFLHFADYYKKKIEKELLTVPIIGEEVLTQELIDKYTNAPAEEGEGIVINHKNGSFKIKSLDYISKA